MNLFVHVALLGWIPFVLALFLLLPPRRAVIAAFVGAWLFLPVAGYSLSGLPNYTKMSATCAGVLLAVALFDPDRLLAFRPRLIDLPMALWCLCPFASSLSNNLGAYDGFSAAFAQTVTWGLPYLIGRIYFTDLPALRELAIGIFIGGLLYIPLCLFEVRMSPKLHYMLYGFHPTWGNTLRFGGWRPMVFMQDGLMVGMWMTAASLVGAYLALSGSLKRLLGFPILWFLLPLLLTTILCKSTGALLLLLLGLAVLLLSRWLQTSLLLLVLLLLSPAYIAARASGQWAGESLVSLAQSVAGEGRGKSLEFRLKNEDLLTQKALQRPLLGWGGWGRARVYNEQGKDISITDGLWIITLGNYGFLGVCALTCSLLLPALLLCLQQPPGRWDTPHFAPVTALAVLLVLYMLDCLPNGMVNPVFILLAGATLAPASAHAPHPVPRPQPAASFVPLNYHTRS